MVLYNRQTEYEKQNKTTKESNNIGFNAYDAKYMTELAKQLLKGKRIKNDDFWRARYRLRKYIQQLTDIANIKEEQSKQYIQQIHDILGAEVNK